MSLYPIILIAVILAADGGLRLTDRPAPDFLEAAIAAWVPVVGILLMIWAGVQVCRARMERRGSARAIVIAERFARYGRWLLIVHHAAIILWLGWLDAIRSMVGDLILIDEMIALLPAVVGFIGTWWLFYPIERRIREAMLLRRLDLGHPIHPMPSRVRYVWEQLRIGLLLLLVPLLLILALAETIRAVVLRFGPDALAVPVIETATLIAAVSVFVLAPLLMRIMLSVQRLPDGPLRDALQEICQRHNVRVRDILLWRTSGSMINAAVMGLFGRLRYVLITDALLDAMNQDQVKAVMAHEVAHVRRHHMPWLILTLIALIAVTGIALEAPLILLDHVGITGELGNNPWMIGSLLAGQVILILWMFGWISRRFERQADTFAVQHLSRHLGNPTSSPGTVDAAAVYAMCTALQTIAELNAVDPHRPSWRHGSIAWRQQYLTSLIGRPLETLPIDRTVRRLKLAAGTVFALGVVGWLLVLAAGRLDLGLL